MESEYAQNLNKYSENIQIENPELMEKNKNETILKLSNHIFTNKKEICSLDYYQRVILVRLLKNLKLNKKKNSLLYIEIVDNFIYLFIKSFEYYSHLKLKTQKKEDNFSCAIDPSKLLNNINFLLENEFIHSFLQILSDGSTFEFKMSGFSLICHMHDVIESLHEDDVVLAECRVRKVFKFPNNEKVFIYYDSLLNKLLCLYGNVFDICQVIIERFEFITIISEEFTKTFTLDHSLYYSSNLLNMLNYNSNKSKNGKFSFYKNMKIMFEESSDLDKKYFSFKTVIFPKDNIK